MLSFYSSSTDPQVLSVTDDDDDDEIAYFTVRWKTRELVLSTAPKTWDNTDKDSKNRKSVRGVYGKRSIGEKIYQKGKFWV